MNYNTESREKKRQLPPCSNFDRQKNEVQCESEKPHIATQVFLFLIVLAVIIPVSIAESKTDNGFWWGFFTIYSVNGTIILWSIITIIHAIRGYYSNREKTFRIYYYWIHFPAEIIFVLVGYLVLNNYDETWILLLNLLTGNLPNVVVRCIENHPSWK